MNPREQIAKLRNRLERFAPARIGSSTELAADALALAEDLAGKVEQAELDYQGAMSLERDTQATSASWRRAAERLGAELSSEKARREGLERLVTVHENVLTVGRLALRGIPLDLAQQAICILRDAVEDWEREQEKKPPANQETTK